MVQKHLVDAILIGLGLLIISVYLFSGFYLKESIFFSYDMPRDALIVQDYLTRGTYLTSQEFFAIGSWLNVSWGPAYIFYYSTLLKISPDPIVIAHMLTIVNLVAIVSIIVLGWKYFSPMVGLISGFLLSVNPYWFTYIRIIYQPSPMTLLIPIAMITYFYAIKLKSIALIFLPIVWTMLFQIYLPSTSFILTSFVFLLFYLKKSSIKHLLVGAVISTFFFIPSIGFYRDNPKYIDRFFGAPSQFTPKETNIIERTGNVFSSYMQIPVGGKFVWQTGDSFRDFVTGYTSNYHEISLLLTIIMGLSLLWNLYYSIIHKDLKRAVILGWAICPLWYLSILWTSDLVPRYFLLAMPSVMILIALFFWDLSTHLKIVWIIPIVIGVYWCVFNFQYNFFIKNYNYPYGWFRDITETPYVYVTEAIDWVLADARLNNCNPILSNDVKNPDFGLMMEFAYPWKYVYKRGVEINENSYNCRYLITHINMVKALTNESIPFGPYAGFRVD